MMSYLIELIKSFPPLGSGQKTATVYYYCYFGHKQDESKPFLYWLISRLCREAKYVPKHLLEICKEGAEASSTSLLQIVADLMSSFAKVYIAVDALDESSDRDSLLDVIDALCTSEQFRALHIVTTSRDHTDIKRAMISISIPCPMDNQSVREDIRKVVCTTLATNQRFRKWPQDLLDEVGEKITSGAHGM